MVLAFPTSVFTTTSRSSSQQSAGCLQVWLVGFRIQGIGAYGFSSMLPLGRRLGSWLYEYQLLCCSRLANFSCVDSS